MTDTEREEMVSEIRVQEFANAMDAHGITGEDAYYVTEILVMWDSVGWDVEHMFLFQ